VAPSSCTALTKRPVNRCRLGNIPQLSPLAEAPQAAEAESFAALLKFSAKIVLIRTNGYPAVTSLQYRSLHAHMLASPPLLTSRPGKACITFIRLCSHKLGSFRGPHCNLSTDWLLSTQPPVIKDVSKCTTTINASECWAGLERFCYCIKR
jgi:hypothetical protein